MLEPGFFTHICKAPEEIPEAAFARLRREVGGGIGLPVSQIFPEFLKAFPLTVSAMETFWPNPIIACKQWRGDWLVTLLLERDDLNLFFDLTTPSLPVEGPDFEKSVSMLPPRWKELYRWFWSFSISDSSVRPIFWRDTPLSYSARMSAEAFFEKAEAKKSALPAFEKKVGASQDNFSCWLWTQLGDALFLNETSCDHRVFHIKNNDPTTTEAISNPEDKLDQYLAHIVSGRSGELFDFRT